MTDIPFGYIGFVQIPWADKVSRRFGSLTAE